MPKRKDYPKWFSIYSKPYVPSKPIKTFQQPTVISEWTGNYETISIPEGTTQIYIEGQVIEQYGDTSSEITVKFYGDSEEVQNAHYEKQLEHYKKEYAKYKEHSEEWKVLEKKWKEEEAVEVLESKKRQYLKLKKELKID